MCHFMSDEGHEGPHLNMHCWCLSFSKPLHCKTNRFFAEYDDVFFNFGDNIGRFFLTKISKELFISPKSVGGNLLYSGDEQNVFFSDQVGAKKFTEFSAKL